MDITATTAPKSDQQNYDDFVGGPKTVTVSEVKAGSAEQPVEIHLLEFPGRPFKPSKSMRRVLVACWGPEASAYVGRRLTLFGDGSVKFGGATVGGIRIAALSDIPKAQVISLTVTRGKRAPFTVQPLLEVDHAAALKGAKTLMKLHDAWQATTKAGASTAELIALKDARKTELAAHRVTRPIDSAHPDYIEETK